MTEGGELRLTVIGSSGSFPGPDSAASCYLVEVTEAVTVPGGPSRTWRVLLDLGSGALGPLQRHLSLTELDAVLLSHLHPDHCLDLCGLYVALRYDPRPPPGPAGAVQRRLPVWGPEGTLDRLIRSYGADDPPDAPSGRDPVPAAMERVYDVRTWQDGGTVQVGPMQVTARRVRHPVAAFGVRIEVGGRVLAYSGDTDTCPGLDELAAGADLLLCEASFLGGRDTTEGVHLTGRRAGDVATRAGVGRLVLTHIPPWTDRDAVRAEAAATFTGPLDVATPGASWVV